MTARKNSPEFPLTPSARSYLLERARLARLAYEEAVSIVDGHGLTTTQWAALAVEMHRAAAGIANLEGVFASHVQCLVDRANDAAMKAKDVALWVRAAAQNPNVIDVGGCS